MISAFVTLYAAGLPAATSEGILPPSPPMNLQLSTAPGGVVLTWDPPAFEGDSPVSSYLIYEVVNGAIREVDAVEANVEEYERSTTGTNFVSYFVKAVNYAGVSPPSNPVTYNCGLVTLSPGMPPMPEIHEECSPVPIPPL